MRALGFKNGLVILIVSIVISYIVYTSICKSKKNRIKIKRIEEIPNNVWLYWENKPGNNGVKPTYIDMCHESVIKNRGKDLNVTILNEKNIKEYLPSLREDINSLSIPQKADYIRLAILNRYGGIWLDSDIIVLKPLTRYLGKLRDYDYVGFGCHGLNCKLTNNGYGNPANWAMISRKGGILIKSCLESADNLLNRDVNLSYPRNYHKLGRELIWDEISKLKSKTNWDYFHNTSEGIERDNYGDKITNPRLMSNELLSNSYESIFVPLYNTAPGFPDYFLRMKRGEILKSKMLISQLFRKALFN